MTELKTLKDIEVFYEKMDTGIVVTNDLKAEAVKLIKRQYKRKLTPELLEWFDFFNITEEDLEEKEE